MVATLLAVLSGTGTAAAETFNLRCPDKSYSYRETTAANGADVRRHELRSGDIAPEDAKYSDGRQRCEKIGRTEFPVRSSLWFSYSFRYSGSMPVNWVTMTQLHSEPESGERTGKPPAFAMHQDHGRLRLLTRADNRVQTTTQVDAVERYSMPWFPANTWQRIVVNVKFDPAGNGRLTFWLNGVQRYSSGPIPIGYNDTVGPNFAQGQYRGASPLTTVFEFANVEIGQTSLLDRVSRPKPLPN